jgi:hypothetical protein
MKQTQPPEPTSKSKNVSVKDDAKKSKWRTKWKVHPVADILPMLTNDELDEMANDIKTNGQKFPITRDADGVILEGRNRLEACERAGVEPQFETLPKGQDEVSFIISANIVRRHLNKGQQAMFVAKIHPEPEERGRGKKSVLNTEFSRESLSHARTVLKFAPVLADSVLSGAVALNAAYDEALMRKQKSETSAERLRRLEAIAPDLATLVREEKLTLPEAEVTQLKRQKQREDELRNARCSLELVLHHLTLGESGRNYIEVLSEFDLERLSLALQNLNFLVEEKTKQLASSKPPIDRKPEPERRREAKLKRRASARILTAAARRQQKKQFDDLTRKSAATSTDEVLPSSADEGKTPPPKREKQTPHEQFRDKLALNGCHTPQDFVNFAHDEGLIDFVNYNKIPESKIVELMKPKNWNYIKQGLDERAAKQHGKPPEAHALL